MCMGHEKKQTNKIKIAKLTFFKGISLLSFLNMSEQLANLSIFFKLANSTTFFFANCQNMLRIQFCSLLKSWTCFLKALIFSTWRDSRLFDPLLCRCFNCALCWTGCCPCLAIPSPKKLLKGLSRPQARHCLAFRVALLLFWIPDAS